MLNRIVWERNEFVTLRTQMEELFDSFFGDLISRYFIPAVGSFADGRVFETDREFVLAIELPGLSAEDIEVTVQGNCLTLKIRQTENHMAGSDRTAGRETITRTSIRNVRLPDDLQTDGIEASYVDGLLKIRLPKKERTTQRIRIRTESGSASHE